MTDKSADKPHFDQGDKKEHPPGDIDSPGISNLTAESQDVQGQERSGQVKVPPRNFEKTASSGNQVNISQNNAKMQRLYHELLAYEKNLCSLMSWKEELKLLTLGANINLAYYDLWSSDANLLFRRCVLIRKRLLEKYGK